MKARLRFRSTDPPPGLPRFPTLLVSLLLACAPPAAQPNPPSGSPPSGCTGALAVAKLQAFFDALNQGDAGAVVAMFPESGSVAFVIQPELEFADTPPFPPGDVHKASNSDELRSLARAAAGYHFQFTEGPHGWAKQLDYVLGGKRIWVWTAGVDGTQWRAVGPGGAFGDGSKVAFNCESGKFLRVLL
ncbi:MAG TPA: hypothetical protein VGS16_08070 [Candidatus Dormibacteraeota bacterium]|nr:hypothetical protein [Candidatus Dormibacteraeota bacterium]